MRFKCLRSAFRAIRALKYLNCNLAALQDFMGFLHIGWDLATTEDLDENRLTLLSPAWEAASRVHLQLQNAISHLPWSCPVKGVYCHAHTAERQDMLLDAWLKAIQISKSKGSL